MTASELFIAAVAAAAAGLVNAIAGGGTLISFPVLLGLGVPPIAANVTNAVALSPGYFGATLAQLGQLRGQERRFRICLPAAILGGIAGAWLLLRTHEHTFQKLVPFMLLFASLLLAFQNRVREFVVRRLASDGDGHENLAPATVAVMLASIYGGFFTAGMSVIVLAVLGATLHDSLTRLNALKQAVAFSVNIAAAVFFVFSGQVLWIVAAAMAAGAVVGGMIGGRVAGRMNADPLRWTVVAVGAGLAVYYWVRG
ncbi:MAG TPA: sulfite exporter TauE/SafE family protein [Povalibacter sp.]|uniref:sulfite exporter TauE/SafE family protein n=1 Tax=Povalibacter sp. TaxID=1962978 RepID=UPI002CF122C3|nr:sulfite exporter TauE/SafE family protein [Povalibacter sp.]HMN43450.1 sulfite exporter TauE/SafE family protein [Povalibacter sp.]